MATGTISNPNQVITFLPVSIPNVSINTGSTYTADFSSYIPSGKRLWSVVSCSLNMYTLPYIRSTGSTSIDEQNGNTITIKNDAGSYSNYTLYALLALYDT